MLAKDVWLKKSNLDVIRKALQSIAAHEKEITEIQRRSDATAVDLFNSVINLIAVVTVNYIGRKTADVSLW